MGTGRRRGIEILLLIIKENVNFDNLDSNQLEVIKRNTRRAENWPKLMTDYSELSEDMKEADRVYARKVYEICKNEFE